jgi:hypothetical protein
MPICAPKLFTKNEGEILSGAPQLSGYAYISQTSFVNLAIWNIPKE